MEGVIFDIKEFSVYDGPGVRTTVFFKGCPLSCRWCHNPEGLRPEPEIWVNVGSCLCCGKCEVPDCDRRVTGTCSACGRCVPLCPNAFRRICGERIDAGELEARLLRQKDFFTAGDGGVTFSGGEPTMQAAFLLDMLERMRRDGIHTAVQTAAFCPAETFERVVAAADFFLFDIKLADREKHKVYTGVPNDRILANLQTLICSGKPFIARTPLIAGINDSRENLAASADLVAGAKGLVRYELLPYNGAAGGKYAMVGRTYPHGDFRAPDRVDLSPFRERGIEVRVL